MLNKFWISIIVGSVTTVCAFIGGIFTGRHWQKKADAGPDGAETSEKK